MRSSICCTRSSIAVLAIRSICCPTVVIGRDGLWNININVNQYITFVPDQKRCRLERTHIVVGGYAADMFGFTLNGNDRDLLPDYDAGVQNDYRGPGAVS